MNSPYRFLLKSIIILSLISAAFLTATGQLDKLLNKLGGTIITDSNNKYLNESFDRSLKGFLILSSLKSGLAVIEGSEVGVGFNLEVGDIVQSIYDYVDIAWKTALAGGTILLLMKLVLQTIEHIDHWCLFFLLMTTLFVSLLYWFFPKQKRISRILKEVLLFVSVFTVSLYIILPFSIGCAAFLSKQITRPLFEEAHSGFQSFQNELTPQALNEKFFSKNQNNSSILSMLDFNLKLRKSKDALGKIAKYLDEITKDFAVWTIKIIAGYLFDCIVFPLAFFVAVYILVRNILVYAIGTKKSHSMKKDFEAILARQLNK